MTRVRREGLEFLMGAPVTFTVEHRFAASPERVFDALADAPGWASWVSIVRKVVWTSDQEGGVGSTRRVSVHGGVTLDEELIAWERPARWGFVITGANLPSFRAGVELAELKVAAGGGTELCYRGGLEFVAGLRPFNRLLARLLPKILRRAFAKLDGSLQSRAE